MPSHPIACFCCGFFIRTIMPAVVLLLVSSRLAAGEPSPTLQDMRLMARVIGLQNRPVSGRVRLGIAFDPGNPASRHVAGGIVAMLGNGLDVGGITLGTVTVAQNTLATSAALDAIFAAPGVDPALLRAALVRLHVPCFTVDPAQLGPGGCMVAVQSDPAVSIVLDQNNAEAAGVHFATAFRMMVQER